MDETVLAQSVSSERGSIADSNNTEGMQDAI